MTRRLVVVALMLLAPLLGPRAVEAQPCEFPTPCTYEGAAFTLTVVDAETGLPVADVHALAEWQNYGMHGRLAGPFMVQDAVSATDGVLRFPRWGPIRGYLSGLVGGNDPVVSLFRPGYEVAVEHNKRTVVETEQVRRFSQDGVTIRLVPFRATPRSWIHQLRTVAHPQVTRMSDDALLQFRGPYLSRFQRVWTEVQLLPGPERSDALREFRILESNLRVLGGQR